MERILDPLTLIARIPETSQGQARRGFKKGARHSLSTYRILI